MPQVLDATGGYIQARRREDLANDALTGTMATVVGRNRPLDTTCCATTPDVEQAGPEQARETQHFAGPFEAPTWRAA